MQNPVHPPARWSDFCSWRRNEEGGTTETARIAALATTSRDRLPTTPHVLRFPPLDGQPRALLLGVAEKRAWQLTTRSAD